MKTDPTKRDLTKYCEFHRLDVDIFAVSWPQMVGTKHRSYHLVSQH